MNTPPDSDVPLFDEPNTIEDAAQSEPITPPSFTADVVAPAALESPAPAGDVTLALTSFDPIQAGAPAIVESENVTPATPADLDLFPSPSTPEEGLGEGSAEAAIEDHTALPVEEPTESLVNDPAPADMEAIAAVASLSPAEAESDPEHNATVTPPLTSDTRPATITAPRKVLSGGWTMGFLLSGIAIIAACVLIPQGDETRKLMYEREKLRADLEQVQKQVATNDEFLQKVQSDPTLAQRLAQRQMKLVPAGTKVLDVDDASPTKDDKSPFLIVSVPPPAPMAPYQPRGGVFAQMCRNGRSQLYMIGAGLMLVAAGLVLGASGPRD